MLVPLRHTVVPVVTASGAFTWQIVKKIVLKSLLFQSLLQLRCHQCENDQAPSLRFNE